MKVLNVCKAVIDTRATRSLDGKITLGELAVTFAKGSIKFSVPEFIREQNLDAIQQMERAIHNFIGLPVNKVVLGALAKELEPIANEIVVA